MAELAAGVVKASAKVAEAAAGAAAGAGGEGGWPSAEIAGASARYGWRWVGGVYGGRGRR